MGGNKEKRLEYLLWSIALPGFPQILGGRYIKGILFVALELLFNVQGNFNQIIMLSFQGDINQAIEQANYPWLMFYPCLYMFAMWDAYRDVEGKKAPYAFLPFVFATYFVTLGVMLSSKLKLFGLLLGPVWLPILFLPLGIGIGLVIRGILLISRDQIS